MRHVGRTGVVCALALLALGGCGSRTPPAQACIEAQPADVVQALAHAPRDVALADGTSLSQCVRRTIDDGRLQEELANRVAGAAAGLDGGPRRTPLLRGRAAGRAGG